MQDKSLVTIICLFTIKRTIESLQSVINQVTNLSSLLSSMIAVLTTRNQ
jgi:hypothetical protein